METFKILMKYIDWLLLNRGEIRPEVGDKIKISVCYYIITEIKENGYLHVQLDNSILQFTKEEIKVINIEISGDIYVEIDYNPNEAIEFAEWILHKEIEKGNFNITSYIDRTDGRKETPIWGNNRLGYGKHYTSEELYQQFKQEQNEK